MDILRYSSLCVVLAAYLATPAAADIRGWFAPSALKVLRDAQPAKAGQRWELFAARNEVEACQLVLISDDRVRGVKVSTEGLRHSRAKAKLPITLHKVEYVPNIVGETPYPDPLPPLARLDLQPSLAQPVWISVRVPSDAAPGSYRGAITVRAAGKTLEFPLSLRVWDFALPETPSCATAFGIAPRWVARTHEVKANSPEMTELYRKYYEMVLDHKISAYSIPADVMSEEAAQYLDDPRMTSFRLPYPADDDALKALIDRLIEHGWFSKGFFYPLDEPINEQAYDSLAAICDRLRRIEPRYRIVTPFFRNPDFGEKLTAFDLMLGEVNIWCANTQYFDAEPTARARFAARKNVGETLWWYVCCGPGAPYNNFFVDMPGMSHRVLFWQQKREGVEGLLYWNTTSWNPDQGCDDPWESMMTVKSINPALRGDGSLLYPGKKVGVDGPVSSQRLEIIRDGIEDFEYLTLAERWLGRNAAREYVARLCTSLTEWEQDPLKLEQVRRELGTALEKSAAGRA